METKQQPKTTIELREQLKAMMETELNNLPALLSELDTKERIGIIVKLLPFIFPKVEPVTHATGEAW